MANLYFIAVAGLSLTPFSPVSPLTTWAPLMLVVGISMLKEALEDYKRYKQDQEQNGSLVDAFSSVDGSRNTVAWRDARVGDVLLVLRDEFFPADLLFLSSSNVEGSCFVETKNLDGETNLKLKKCVEPTQELREATVGAWKANLECDAPNNSLYTFMGNLLYNKPGESESTTLSVGPSNILLRGSNLRNTEWILGCVVYAGHDTKVMMNAMAAPSKRSGIERRLDKVRMQRAFAAFARACAHSHLACPSSDCGVHALAADANVPGGQRHHGAAHQKRGTQHVVPGSYGRRRRQPGVRPAQELSNWSVRGHHAVHLVRLPHPHQPLRQHRDGEGDAEHVLHQL